jgi:hypothetical protein
MERNEMIHIVLPIHNRKPITCRFIKQLKRQREVAFAEMQRQEMERRKHMKAPILYRPG